MPAVTVANASLSVPTWIGIDALTNTILRRSSPLVPQLQPPPTAAPIVGNALGSAQRSLNTARLILVSALTHAMPAGNVSAAALT